ncbi:hypothetical protein DFH08DRAFT_879385 [Mycena albidolilacea]|uniref:Uncharacterized protein n=1 Tax=Mycena albidolilacea TaxID=1033008 RepID=A0AAD6ZR52_9AGAR|nr:hypothetical protein DFH08DRAFT_879385 [Mycena albidolilacea]
MPPSSTAHSFTRVGSPPTPFLTADSRLSSSSKRYRESTHLIPTPGVGENRPKQYVPLYLSLPVVIGTPLLMLGLGIALEIGVQISYKNGGFAVAQRNVFSFVSTQFLLSFFPTLFVIPVGYMWRVLDWTLRRYQPYVTMAKGNATAEESVLLDYILLGSTWSMFRALKYNHRVIFWSCLLATWTYLFQPLAGSIFQIQTRDQTEDTHVQSIRTLGLAPDISQLNAFAAAAGFVQAAVFNNLTDPPFVHLGWSTAQFVFPTDTGLNGSMTVNTTGIRSNSNCANPAAPGAAISVVNATSSIISAKSVDGCTGNVTFDPTVSDQQYGVSAVPSCGPNAGLSVDFWPVVFWFYNKEADGTQETRTIFCNPTLELFYVNAFADLSNGSLTNVVIVNNYTTGSNITGAPLNGVPYNAVIFEDNANPFIEARATATKVGVPGAIFRSALQKVDGLQSVFGLANGFLDLTSTVYTQHLAVAAKSVYFVVDDTEKSAVQTFMVPRLWIDPFPAHILAFFLFATGFLGVFLQLINRRQRRNLFLAAAPGSLAAAVALTSRSGFGDLLLPYDDDLTMEKKLDGLRFRLDKRTGAILADDYEPAGDDPIRGPDDAMMSLLGHGQNRQTMQSLSSTQLAQEAALEQATGIPAWKREELRTPYDT